MNFQLRAASGNGSALPIPSASLGGRDFSPGVKPPHNKKHPRLFLPSAGGLVPNIYITSYHYINHILIATYEAPIPKLVRGDWRRWGKSQNPRPRKSQGRSTQSPSRRSTSRPSR